jgi:lysophospholipase L1-like esterase
MFQKICCLILALAVFTSLSAQSPKVNLPANSPLVNYTGRIVESPSGDVTFDWAGTYFQFLLKGDACAIRASDTGESYYNVFADNALVKTIRIASRDTLVQLATGLAGDKVLHIRVQKRSEGEFGRTTVHGFVLPEGAALKGQVPEKDRFIEFIGDSHTVGYGTDGTHRDEPFEVSTENPEKTYATILARYFGADYALIAHSGRGAARNYGDSLSSSKYTMKDALLRTLNSDTTTRYGFDQYKPDLVVINLGSNDFSTRPNPSKEEFVAAYSLIIQRLRAAYGSETKILCVTPRVSGPVGEYIAAVLEELKDSNLFATASLRGVMNDHSDMGAAWHPGYSGQRKMAMFIAPYVATIMNWPLEDRPLK